MDWGGGERVGPINPFPAFNRKKPEKQIQVIRTYIHYIAHIQKHLYTHVYIYILFIVYLIVVISS